MSVNQIFLLFSPTDHPRSIWHDPPHTRDPESETPALRECFYFLDKTSRSFSAVIKELNHELLVPICLFYLILRGLDTIEDDMSIPLKEKDQLLRNFHSTMEQDGWTYNGNHAKEKDRELLVRFNVVVEELKKIPSKYQIIIKDITKAMGNGMADYAHDADFNEKGVNTIKDYEKYCHWVAGILGEGLTRLFVEGNCANPALAKRPDLFESMGQFLQQTNVIRDIREDADEKRRFWPREVWSKYVDDFDDLFKKENRDAALRCSSEMILLALERAPDCLFYLAGMRDQSCFNFAAIPQTMAIATLELCFRNPALFERNIKITRGEACALMTKSSQNLQILYETFRVFARRIHKKNDPRDPNFLKISVACGKVRCMILSMIANYFNADSFTDRTIHRVSLPVSRSEGRSCQGRRGVIEGVLLPQSSTSRTRGEEETRRRSEEGCHDYGLWHIWNHDVHQLHHGESTV